MTKIVLEIPYQQDLDLLIALADRLHIRYTKLEAPLEKKEDLSEAIQVIKNGCDMGSFGDAASFQSGIRNDRSLPFRD